MKRLTIPKRYVYMEQESYKIGIIGAGPAGCTCAYFIKKALPNANISIIDYGAPMRTILPTGGSRCNFTNSEYDIKELVKNYPRGEKFLYSIFSKFSTGDSLSFFEELGIKSYSQEDGRVFPISNDSKEVQNKFLLKLKTCNFIKEKALRIEKSSDGFKVVTDMNSYHYDKLVIATGGHNGYDLIKQLGVTVINPKPALVGLVTEEKFNSIMGCSVEYCINKDTDLSGTILFTHFGISGPLIYKISSIKAAETFPYNLSFDICPQIGDLQEILNANPHKFIKNILSQYLPNRLSDYLLNSIGIDTELKCHRIDGKKRNLIEESLHNFTVTVTSTKKDGETVTAGGVNLDKINPKTMESKEVKGLYFCGEVIDVDGFCGGFNLQNCWSTGFVAAEGILNS